MKYIKMLFAHGWHETVPPIAETISLIHCEWSEAMEEYRAGRPFVWYNCTEGGSTMINPCNPESESDCLNFGKADCPYQSRKPEGIAVELMDGVIRIFDLMAQYEYQFYTTTMAEAIGKTMRANPFMNKDTPLPELTATLHSLTAKAGEACTFALNKLKTTDKQSLRAAICPLEAAIGFACYWVKVNGLDPEKIILEKHEYNKGRPWKHGKLC